MPVGSITTHVRSERDLVRQAAEPPPLPSGFVTMLLTDIEGSRALVYRLGNAYGDLLERLRSLLRETMVGSGGHVVETRAHEFFAVFETPVAALRMAVTVQRELRAWASTAASPSPTSQPWSPASTNTPEPQTAREGGKAAFRLVELEPPPRVAYGRRNREIPRGEWRWRRGRVGHTRRGS